MLNNLFQFSRFQKFVERKWKVIPLLDRWIIFELLPPLFFSIAAFTVVSLSVGVVFDLIRKIVEIGLPFSIAIQILLLKLPSFIVISFPMAMLLSTLLAYGTLNENSEIKALKSIGISIYRLILPGLILSIFMSYMTFIFNNNIVPSTNRNAEIILANSLGRSFSSEQGEDIIFSKKGEILDPYSSYKKRGVTHLFYAWKFVDGQMLDVTVIDFSKLGFTQMLKAKKGIWNNNKNNWEFFEGDILTLSPDGSNTRTKFLSFLYPLGTDLTNIAQLPKDANDMNLGEATTAMELYQRSGNIKEARRMKVRIQEKFTLPIACSVFALIGCSFGVMQKKGGGRSQSFGLSIILILIYYVLSFSFSSLGVKGILNPFIAAWSPVFLSMLGGGFLLKQASK
ncbi:LptF/LptG family permease [Prochlorococcus marinus]|uniref:Permease n=1 Tax=Prochlorococcus marinus XMU1408 TaxID=2213228 RepID=A0A318R5V2_PROMR|nr:LptF/LptG family permease [Prochlorococcus marinus]MBW3041767.1 permease [Prochlorococcus marinus str. XMU1408]PYE02911.1 permease [Prochlorococcus marinus XMU1408]